MKDFTPAYGIVPPLLTPFNQDRSIDWPAYAKLIEWHISKGVSGVFVVCSSSEYWQLTEDEAIQMAKAAVKAADGAINVVAGTTMSPEDDIDQHITQTRRMWDEAGVQGCFLATPRKMPPEDNLMVDYFMRIHDATDAQVFAYEMPGGNDYKFSPEAFAAVGKGERFIGIKDTTCNLEKVRQKIEAAQGTIKIMEANTPNFLESLKLGSTGGINTSNNIAPELFSTLCSLVKKGDLETAAELHRRIVEIDEKMSPGYVMTAKIVVRLFGVPVKHITRTPAPSITPQRMRELEALAKLIVDTEKEFEGVV